MGVYDERLQFMSFQDAQRLSESLGADDVSHAWLVWSGAAEAALADAFRICGGPVPTWGLVIRRGSALFRIVRLGGHKVKKVRDNVSDVVDGAGVFLYRDSSIAPLLDMRRRFEGGYECSWCHGSLLNSLLSGIRSLLLDPVVLLLMMTLVQFGELGIGVFHRVVSGLHRRLREFIHSVVVHRRDDAIREWPNWIREDPLTHPNKWLRPDLVPPAPFLQCKPHLTPGGCGVLADPARIDEEFRKTWLPYFCRSGQMDTSLEEFNREVDGWLPLLPEVALPPG